jgi:phage protein D
LEKRIAQIKDRGSVKTDISKTDISNNDFIIKKEKKKYVEDNMYLTVYGINVYHYLSVICVSSIFVSYYL